jgi:hypothetical protein
VVAVVIVFQQRVDFFNNGSPLAGGHPSADAGSLLSRRPLICAQRGVSRTLFFLLGGTTWGRLYPTPRQRRECRMVRVGSQHPRDLVLVSACACLLRSRSGRRRRVGEISPTTCVVTIGKTSVMVCRGTTHGPCGFNYMSDGRRRPLLGTPRQPVDCARTNSAGRRAGGGRHSSNITLAGLEL